MWDGYLFANPDGDDYEPLGKYYKYRLLLRRIRENDSISEEVKLRRINHLKEVVFPLWHRGEEIHKREKEELKAVFLKYNGPEGPRTSYGQECDEIRAQIAASDDAVLLEDMDLAPVYGGASGYRDFTYGKEGAIVYNGMDMGHEKEVKESSSELPVINLVPLGADDGISHHHNKNPDDDLSLNPTLLKLLHRLMDHNLAAPFINFDDEKRGPEYYFLVKRPRWFKFIEQGLTSDPSLGYGATAFFNDMLLLFHNPARWTIKPTNWDAERAIMLETEMKMMLQKMGSVGEQFLALYAAIEEQGPEPWGGPEILYFQEPHHPRLPGYNGTEPDLKAIKAAAWDQLKLGQQRVQQLRSRLASTVSNTGQSDPTPALAGGAPLNHEPGKQPHEESAEPAKDGLNHEPKSQQYTGSASPRPSDPDTAPPGPAAAKRPRAPADNDGDARDEEAEEGRATKRPKLLPENITASSSTTAMSSGAVASGSHTAAPQGSASKRARTPADNDGDAGDEEVEEGRATKRPKLRLKMRTASSSTTAMSSAAVASSSRAGIPEQPASKRARTPADVDGDGDDQGDGAVGEPSRSKRRRHRSP